MKLIKREGLVLILLTLVIAFGIKAFAIPGLYTSHDGETHTARLANYYLALKEGQLPPALAPTLFGGFGFPIFIFIYPLPYFVGAAIHSLGSSYTDATEITMALAHVLSGLAFYLFLKLETKKTLPAIIGALFFTWAPYRFLMLFVRGAFAESFSYLFIASSLLAFNRLLTRKNSLWFGLTSLSLAGLLLSHQLTSVMFLPLLVWYFATKVACLKNKKAHLIRLGLSLALAFLIAAFIYLPAFFERGFLRFDELINYSLDHFVTIKQLIRSPWSYGFSHSGTLNDDMSFQIGLTHLAAAALAVLTLFYSFKKKQLAFLADNNLRGIALWLLPFFISVVLMLEHPLVRWIWENIPGFNYLDFPWRFLGVTVTAISFIAAYLVARSKNNLLLVAFLLFFVFYANRNHLRINEPVLKDDHYFNNYPATATWRNEFLPKARATNKWQGIQGDYQILTGDPQVTEVTNLTQKLELSINSSKPSELLIHRLYFPGWKVSIDGRTQKFNSDSFSVSSSINLETGVDFSGFIKTKIPPGQHKLSVRLTKTPLRKLGITLSMLGLAITLIAVFLPKRKTHSLLRIFK